MNSGLYAACAALIARTQSLDIAANNLANANTAGYRSERTTFRSALARQASNQRNAVGRATNDFAVLSGSRPDLTQGTIESTASDFDCAIEGQAFFAIQAKAGTRYTRNGHFQLSASGELITPEGDQVLGDKGPVRLPKGVLSISVDGTMSVNGALAGKLRLVEFAPGTALASDGNTRFIAPDGAEFPARNSIVRQGAIEASNLNPIAASVDLIALQRHAELLQRTLTIFHSDFNRIATEDLPRV